MSSKITYRFFVIIGLLLMASSCVKEQLRPDVGNSGQGGEVWVDLAFGDHSFRDVQIGPQTKATLGVVAESRIQNIFIYVFMANDQQEDCAKLYAKYFDASNLYGSQEEVREMTSTAWWRENKRETQDDSRTHGVLHMKMPVSDNANIYAIANMDADMVNISAEKLNAVRNEAELNELLVRLNQMITSRNGYFPMTAVVKGVQITPKQSGIAGEIIKNGQSYSGTSSSVATNNALLFERIDAKVSVNVRIATDYTAVKSEGGVSTVYKAKQFIPSSWRVVNLPREAALIKRVKTDNAADLTPLAGANNPDNFFTSTKNPFEVYESQSFQTIGSDGLLQDFTDPNACGFSFYMMENLQRDATKNPALSIQAREEKKKEADGTFSLDDDIWKHAPQYATYLEIEGEVLMSVDASNEAKTQQLSSVLKYYVHLGDFGSDTNDYNIVRNTSYTYNINIKGVDAIETEVMTSQDGIPEDVIESNPGAEGMVYIAKESLFTFDSHYGQRVFSFDAAYIDPRTVTWYVKTPFGREGVPMKIGDTEVGSGMDYKWVHFKINRDSDRWLGLSDPVGNPTQVYPNIKCNRWYPGDQSPELLNIIEFTKYINEQKRSLEALEQREGKKAYELWASDPDFLKREAGVDFIVEEDSLWKAKFADRPDLYNRVRLYVTAYVDEYYYESDPITGEHSEGLWKQFTNTDNRLMHILCDNQKSLDGASTATGSVITIRQRSIQTPYNKNKDDLIRAWGTETIDELENSAVFFYGPSEQFNINGNNDYTVSSAGPRAPTHHNNDSRSNGLYNTCQLLNLIQGNTASTATFRTDARWAQVMDYAQPNSENQSDQIANLIKPDYLGLLWGVLARNRDDNGDGLVSADEIKWYVGAIEQYYALYIGGEGLDSNAWLYPGRFSKAPNERYNDGTRFNDAFKWRVRMVSSSWVDNKQVCPDNRCAIIWAEEGITTARYDANYTMPGSYSIRALRNLGINNMDGHGDGGDWGAHLIASRFDKAAHQTDLPQDLFVFTKEGEGADAVYTIDLSNILDASRRYYTTKELEPASENSEMARTYTKFQTGGRIALPYMDIPVDEARAYPKLREILSSGETLCPEGYRIPNVREGVIMSFVCSDPIWWNPQGGNETRALCSTYYSLKENNIDNRNEEKIRSWEFCVNTASLQGNCDMHIRCVRDIH